MTTDSITVSVISTKPPFSSLLAKEALQIALASASYGFKTKLLLMGEGVYQLLKHQEPETDISKASLLPLLRSLPFYNINTIYVEEESLKEKNISMGTIDTQLNITQLNSPLILELFQNSSNIFTF